MVPPPPPPPPSIEPLSAERSLEVTSNLDSSLLARVISQSGITRRWARRGPGENPGRFLLCVREHSTGPGLGERSWRVWARAHGMGGSRGKRVTLGRQEWASDPWMGNKGGRGAGKRNLLGSRVPFSPHWAPSYFSRPGYYLILLYSSSLLLLRLDS